MVRRTGTKGIELIKKFEGFEPVAYKDIAGIWTVGYGHTRSAVPNLMISPAEGEKLLREDIRFFEQRLTGWLIDHGVDLNINEYDALISFCFNIGFAGFAGSTCARRLKQGDFVGAMEALQWWNKADVNQNGITEPHEVVRGLQRRRAAEAQLFFEPVTLRRETPQVREARAVKVVENPNAWRGLLASLALITGWVIQPPK